MLDFQNKIHSFNIPVRDLGLDSGHKRLHWNRVWSGSNAADQRRRHLNRFILFSTDVIQILSSSPAQVHEQAAARQRQYICGHQMALKDLAGPSTLA